MTGAASRIIVYKSAGGYRVQVSGRFGGGFESTRPGTPAEVAPFVAAQMQRYAVTNSKHGGTLFAPPEISDLIPEWLRNIGAR